VDPQFLITRLVLHLLVADNLSVTNATIA